MLDDIRAVIAEMLAEASGMKAEEILPTLEAGRIGEVSSKAAFVLAQKQKANPAKLAADMAAKLGKNKYVDRVEATGPYLNFYLSGEAYLSILDDILRKKDKYGMAKRKKGKIIIEYPSVNPNKPWHIGHLRNAVLGEAVARLLEFDGRTVERMNYIDDLGLQVAQSLWGFLNFDSNPQGKFDTWLGHQYVGIAKKFEEDKDVVEDVRDVMKSMEEGDNDIARAGRELAENCVRAQYETAFAFGVHHNVLIFESDIMRTIFDEGIAAIKENQAVVLETGGKNAGCWVVKLSEDFEKEFGKMENPDKVLIRSDGTAVYTGKDVIFHLWKFGKLKNDFKYEPFLKQPNGITAYKSSPKGNKMELGHADEAINVICVDQKYPQRVIVEVLKKMDYGRAASNLRHLSYELVGLPEGKFSGRKGTWVGYTADDLLAEAETRVMEKIKPEFGNMEKKSIAKKVGVGAIKFSFLRTSSDKRITFRWEEALNMEGNSGPYVQYAYVRTNGILAKTGEKPELLSASFNPAEKQLLRRLAQFSDSISRSAKEMAPHHLAQYILDVAADFTAFYDASPVLKAEDEKTRKTRLAITLATAIVLKNGLELLGIECPEKM